MNKASSKYKRLPNEFHRQQKFKGGKVHRNKKKYYRPSEKEKQREEKG